VAEAATAAAAHLLLISCHAQHSPQMKEERLNKLEFIRNKLNVLKEHLQDWPVLESFNYDTFDLVNISQSRFDQLAEFETAAIEERVK
jgi:hypothetical protein